MGKNRLEAFSDGVLAIIITIMVLEMKPPHSADFDGLRQMAPIFFSYVLSFLYIGIYWNNHHHLLHTVRHVNGAILWANLHLLFWLSLFPFVTAWMGEHHQAPFAAALYGFPLFMAGIAYWLLQKAIVKRHGPTSLLADALGKDLKGNLSVLLYAIAIPAAFWQVWIAYTIYASVAVMWLIPDTRIEHALKEEK